MIKKILLVLAILLVLIQFVKLDKNNANTPEVADFIKDTEPSKEVQAILGSKCYDCHSNKTTYPWYSNIAPFSFWINHHVEEGKEHLNFSNWENYKQKRKIHKLEEVYEEVDEGEMPLKSFTILHGDLTEQEIELLTSWAKTAIVEYN